MPCPTKPPLNRMRASPRNPGVGTKSAHTEIGPFHRYSIGTSASVGRLGLFIAGDFLPHLILIEDLKDFNRSAQRVGVAESDLQNAFWSPTFSKHPSARARTAHRSGIRVASRPAKTDAGNPPRTGIRDLRSRLPQELLPLQGRLQRVAAPVPILVLDHDSLDFAERHSILATIIESGGLRALVVAIC